ncbi:acyltransferase [Cellulosimicrobium cellulans]|uniref:acyltransferase n=1 Tax=Cellulosimicrobium cellulans TaxID=1710 RepID=UPI002097449A|nr:acyltransferase [Cellulosimicrobium cellulans]MCO7274290.1 acyltransferase [Cellulosimicrobium cellulans]
MSSSAVPTRTARVGPSGLEWVSWLRVLAIVAVVCIHVVGHDAIVAGARETFHGNLAIWLDFGSDFAVPVFVMVSGALLLDPARYVGTTDFLRKRALRLLPAVVVWHLLWWVFLVTVLGEDVGVRAFVAQSATGRLYTALYFFWIVLGLALVTPVLVPWVSSAGRRAVGVAGAVLVGMTAASAAGEGLLGLPTAWVQTAWTWWIPYLGLYLLGWALRDVVLRGRWLAAATVGAVGIGLLQWWLWENPAAPELVRLLLPTTYYGFQVQLYAVLVYLVVKSVVRPGGALGTLARPRVAATGRVLGDATLGVFVLHLMVWNLMLSLPVVGGDEAAGSVPQMLGRVAFVLVVTYAIVLLLRRVPVVRRVV